MLRRLARQSILFMVMNRAGRSKRRLSHLLVAILLLFVQLHLCQAEYVLPGGEKCYTCVALDEADHGHAPLQVSEGEHGDCHDCCEIRPCDEGGKNEATVVPTSQNVLLMALPTALPNLVVPTVDEPYVTFVYLAGCPPTGPPTESRSRAPPAFSDL